MSVSNRLLRLDKYVFKAKILKHSLDRFQSCSVKRRIDDGNILRHLLDDFRMNGQITKLSEVLFIHFIGNALIKTFLHRFFLIHGFNHVKRSHLGNLIHNIGIMRRCNLCTVLPIYFISVIFSWIMARSNYNTRNTSKFPDRK